MSQRKAGRLVCIVASFAFAFLLMSPPVAEAADTDGDGFDDTIDNCIAVANPNQADTDADGLGDRCDVCPNGIDIDSDADGVCDTLDRCPGSDDGLDADADGLPSGCDNCPLSVNNGQADVDSDGIGNACDSCTDLDGDGVGDAGFTNTACGVSNGPDNCRFAANPSQVDTDMDTLGDACDSDAASSAASVIGGTARKLKNNKTLYFGSFASFGLKGKPTITESDAQWIMPIAGTLSNFYVRLSENAGDVGVSYTFTVRVNGAAPIATLTCAISGATATCSDTTNVVAFSAGDLIAIESIPSSPTLPANGVDVQWSASLAGS